MNHHRTKRNDFRLEDGRTVTIESWTHGPTASVAAFGSDGHQISTTTYQAHMDNPDRLTPEEISAMIDRLAIQLEYDLINKPDTLLRTH